MFLHSILTAAVFSTPVAHANLHQLAIAAGKQYFGAATDNPELSNKNYTEILKNAQEFGQITPGNGQKWESTEATQGTLSYTLGDEIADFAKTNGQLLRCHTLVWHSQLPTWGM
jgi:endo-1,4-beta-xylanase